MSRRKQKRKLGLFVFFLPVILIAGILLYLNPDWGYLLTSGLGREKVSIESTTIPLVELSVDELRTMENVTFDQSMLLINTEHMLSENFTAETGEYKQSGVYMNVCILEAYTELSAAVTEKTGDKLYISSGIRDRVKQQKLYEQDPETATVPGASEHETGLCMDVYVTGFAGDGFLKSEAGMFINSHGHEYGFIIRYPNYGEEITGIRFEPWHIRYVGQPHADIIYNNKLTLEEYILEFKEGICYETERYFIIRQRIEEGVLKVPDGCESYVISPDNTGCYFITGKKKVSQIRNIVSTREITLDQPPF
ncbi:MAG: D-alanyl-D-alanine carboxypeptidase family protein [Lachnospiraceae bacterium]|nr:D-alanyl-D-alanine carboxypeptidase family protein [Lachnospiraceae bacterium]